MARERLLSRDEARAVYDRIGAWVDWQSLFEDVATADLTAHLDLPEARSLVELGPGTGRFAERVLSLVPADASYVAFDVSSTIQALAARRLAAFGSRVQVRLTSGQVPLPLEASSCDRFLSNYVLDLLSTADIEAVLCEAHRVLRPGGLLGLVSLTRGFTLISKLFERGWTSLHALRPALVGGCRPIALAPPLAADSWQILHHRRLSRFGVPSEVVVAEKNVS